MGSRARRTAGATPMNSSFSIGASLQQLGRRLPKKSHDSLPSVLDSEAGDEPGANLAIFANPDMAFRKSVKNRRDTQAMRQSARLEAIDDLDELENMEYVKKPGDEKKKTLLNMSTSDILKDFGRKVTSQKRASRRGEPKSEFPALEKLDSEFRSDMQNKQSALKTKKKHKTRRKRTEKKQLSPINGVRPQLVGKTPEGIARESRKKGINRMKKVQTMDGREWNPRFLTRSKADVMRSKKMFAAGTLKRQLDAEKVPYEALEDTERLATGKTTSKLSKKQRASLAKKIVAFLQVRDPELDANDLKDMVSYVENFGIDELNEVLMECYGEDLNSFDANDKRKINNQRREAIKSKLELEKTKQTLMIASRRSLEEILKDIESSADPAVLPKLLGELLSKREDSVSSNGERLVEEIVAWTFKYGQQSLIWALKAFYLGESSGPSEAFLSSIQELPGHEKRQMSSPSSKARSRSPRAKSSRVKSPRAKSGRPKSPLPKKSLPRYGSKVVVSVKDKSYTEKDIAMLWKLVFNLTEANTKKKGVDLLKTVEHSVYYSVLYGVESFNETFMKKYNVDTGIDSEDLEISSKKELLDVMDFVIEKYSAAQPRGGRRSRSFERFLAELKKSVEKKKAKKTISRDESAVSENKSKVFSFNLKKFIGK